MQSATSSSPAILLVDDDGDACISLVRALQAQFQPAGSTLFVAASSPDKAMQLARQHTPAVAVIDLNLEPSRGVESGFELLKSLLDLDASLRVIVLTGHESVEYGVRAMRSGAASFIGKPANIAHLSALIRDGFAQASLRRAFVQLEQAEALRLQAQLCAESPRMREVLEDIRFAAQSTQPVLLLGETGTGKSLCARLLHELGPRKPNPFVRYQPNFASPDLCNSELFGHARGAFTGATEDKRGLVVEADRGTLFLDEIEELPKELQVTLLGVLQDKRVRAVGATRETTVDFRLICATNGNVEKAIREGRFRADLYHRISSLSIELPPLRERREDISLIAERCLLRLAERESLPVHGFSAAAIAKLSSFSWPGNIRQLEGVIENAGLRAHFQHRAHVGEDDIQLPNEQASSPVNASFHSRVEAYKVQLVEDALKQCGGNQVRAAELLELDRSSLRRILARIPRLEG